MRMFQQAVGKGIFFGSLFAAQCTGEEFRRLGMGQGRKWNDFLKMFVEVKEPESRDGRENPLLEALTQDLRARLSAMSPAEIRKAVEAHCAEHEAELKRKLDDRAYSKLMSVRLTVRELDELKWFADPGGCNLVLDRYLAGRR